MKKKHKNQHLNNSKNKPSVPITPEPFLKASLSRRFLILSQILIIALGFIAYTNSLNGKFIFDDETLIKENNFTKSFAALPDCFTKNLYAGSGISSNTYRPLQLVTYTINYAMGKLDVRGYHLTNMLLHIAVALCIFWLIQAFFNDKIISLITAILFVVHPVHTEAVSYIAGRADSLASFFMLLCMIIYLKLISSNRFNILGIIFLVFTYTCALFSKEYSLFLPLLLLFYHFVFGKKMKAVEFFSLLGIAIIYMAMRLTCFKSMLFIPSGTDTVLDRMPGFFIALFEYIKLLFLPFGLHMEYGQKIFAWTDLRAIGGIMMAGGILAWGYFKRNNKIILFAIGWFFLTLLPVSNLYKIDAYMAEHFLYLPSIGFFLLIAHGFSLLYNNGKYKISAIILASAAVIYFAALTIMQNNYWKDPRTFYETTLKFAPESSKVYNNLGEIYQKDGDLTKALGYYTKSIEIDPKNVEAHNNRGGLYDVEGNYAQAIPDLNRALELNPNYADAYNNRGNAYNSKGDFDKAIEDLNKAIELNPDYSIAYFNRGNSFSNKGNYDQAILDFNKSIELNPDYSLAYFNRGNTYNSQGNLSQAILDLDRAIELNPSFAEAYRSRGSVYGKQGNYDQAILDFNKAIELNPKDFECYNNRGNAYGYKGNFDQAILDFSRAIELKSDFAQAYNNRFMAYYFQKNYDKAWPDVHKAIELGSPVDPKFLEALKQASGRDN